MSRQPAVSDKQLLRAINSYRQRPHVADLHGPHSLSDLLEYMRLMYPHLKVPANRGSLHPRIHRLIDQGLLAVSLSNTGRVIMATARLTDAGQQMIKEEFSGGIPSTAYLNGD